MHPIVSFSYHSYIRYKKRKVLAILLISGYDNRKFNTYVHVIWNVHFQRTFGTYRETKNIVL